MILTPPASPKLLPASPSPPTPSPAPSLPAAATALSPPSTPVVQGPVPSPTSPKAPAVVTPPPSPLREASKKARPYSGKGKRSLAFPLLGLTTNELDYTKPDVVAVTAKAIAAFLDKHRDADMRLVLVAHQPADAIAQLRAALAEKPACADRFAVLERDPLEALVALNTAEHPCRFVVSETNWRFNSTATLLGKAVFGAAGNSLLRDTKKKYATAECGRAYPVELSTASQLTDEQVQWVIHVNPPNMNPKKPDYLKGNYEDANELLESCYTSAFETFYELAYA